LPKKQYLQQKEESPSSANNASEAPNKLKKLKKAMPYNPPSRSLKRINPSEDPLKSKMRNEREM
jgi:hypothetical protein